MHTKTTRVIVGLSGGVDSAVTLHLLKEQGYLVEAVFMQNWEEPGEEGICTAEVDLKDAMAVADHLGVRLQVVNFAESYWQHVFAHFLDEYKCGRTPNPDILCNKEIKFKALLNYIKNQGASYLATGHYARISKDRDEGVHLLKARDLSKDQSYFLHALSQDQLAHSLFPVGELLKTEVRAIAQQIGLPNYNKKDSTGICFIGERSFKKFLSDYLPQKPGPMMTPEGEVIGQHDGLMFYTLGQRKDLKIGGQKGRPESPWYVAAKNMQQNTLIVVQGEHHPALFQTSLVAKAVHWINPPPPFPYECFAKTRYRQQDQACQVEKINKTDYRVSFSVPQRAITPGQSVVFYQQEECLGGGIIE